MNIDAGTMTAQFAQAPHRGRPALSTSGAPNAALLIDFDNVTMGIRNDLSKELKNLLNSDIIKGKVAVQRAYADWRRYPQYIVPLSEASVDLIFAPAYGSSKKNATDIRLAIDALELVFTRPEIGTYIILSGDADFSSLVLKLKEYGKYVVGVGMQESRSDLLVQNCDEYYSYSALTGLTRAGDEVTPPSEDPWELVERAVTRMASRKDVMRSDRLKQVMLELNPSFDEKELGYSKFNKFMGEAANRNRVRIRKLENGQFEVSPADGAKSEDRGGRSGDGRRGAQRSSGRRSRRPSDRSGRKAESGDRDGSTTRDLDQAYTLLRRAVTELTDGDKSAARDSDVKRRLLEMEPDWDERDYGFSKFSLFLRKAHDAEAIELRKRQNGIYEVLLTDASAGSATDDAATTARTDTAGATERDTGGRAGESAGDRESRARGAGLLYRRGTRGRSASTDSPPPLLDGQTVSLGGGGAQSPEAFAASLKLPTEAGAVVRYIKNSYKGVGQKTAEALIDTFGAERVFWALQHEADRVRDTLGGGPRGNALFEAWQADYQRRRDDGGSNADSAPAAPRDQAGSESSDDDAAGGAGGLRSGGRDDAAEVDDRSKGRRGGFLERMKRIAAGGD